MNHSPQPEHQTSPAAQQSTSVSDTQPSQDPQIEQLELLRRSNKHKLRWGLICLIAPTLLPIIGILLYAVINFTFSSIGAGDSSELSAGSRVILSTVNVLLFLVSGVAILTWLPGIIVGIVLLATRYPVPPSR